MCLIYLVYLIDPLVRSYLVLKFETQTLFRIIKPVSSNSIEVDRNTIIKKMYFIIGLAGGVIGSLSGLGGGVVMVTFFHSLFK